MIKVKASSDLKLKKVGILDYKYLSEIYQSSGSTKLFCSILLSISSARTVKANCGFIKSNYKNKSASELIADFSCGLFSKKSVRYFLNQLKSKDIRYSEESAKGHKLICENEYGIKINMPLHNFFCVFKLENASPQLQKPSLILNFSYLLELSFLNFRYKNCFGIYKNSILKIALKLGFSEKTVRNDIKTLIKHNLISEEKGFYKVNQELAEQYLLTVKYRFKDVCVNSNSKTSSENSKEKTANEILKININAAQKYLSHLIDRNRNSPALNDIFKNAIHEHLYERFEMIFGKAVWQKIRGDFENINPAFGMKVNNTKGKSCVGNFLT